MRININIFFLIILIIVCLIVSGSTYYLVIYDNQGKVLEYFPVEVGEQFVISFIHSSELEPWDNVFVVEKDKSFSLNKIIVPSTGPGVPSVLEKDWKLNIKNGNLIYEVNNKNYKSINFIVSQISPHFLTVKGQKINLVELAGNWASLKIKVQKGIIPYLKEGLK